MWKRVCFLNLSICADLVKDNFAFVWSGQENTILLLEIWQGADNVMTLY